MKHAALLAILSIFASHALCAADASSSFSDGNNAYVAAASLPGDEAAASYAKAVECYEQALKDGGPSWTAEFNLGNSYYKLGDYGKALLHYERALATDPLKPETRANMEQLRKTAGLSGMREEGRIESWALRVPMNGWMWAGALFGWAFLAAVVLPPLYGRHRLATISASVAAFALFSICILGMYGWHIHAKWQIVTAPDTLLKSAPAEEASTIRQIPPASYAKVMKTHGDWEFVRTENGDEGWLSGGKAEEVWER